MVHKSMTCPAQCCDEAEGAPCRYPSKDSEEYRQLLGLGRAAAAYGQTTAARQLYEAAGAWSELLSLCALQGDFMSVRDYIQSVWPLPLSTHMCRMGS